jgi:hypothetical protein
MVSSSRLPGFERSSAHKDEVRRLMPADRDRVSRSQPLAGGFPQLVLTPDDELAGVIGLNAVLGLVAEVGSLIDSTRN